MNLNNKTKKKADFFLTVVLILGIFLAVNFISYLTHFFRWDLTQNNIYSISEVSKTAVADLDDLVLINAYFSDDLPSQVLSLKQEVADILDEYQVYSNGNISVQFIDPKDDEELKKELYMLGLPELTFQVFEKDKRQTVQGYMGIEIKYGTNSEVIPVVKQDTTNLEYQLTSAIKKVAASEPVVIGILTSHETLNIENEFSSAFKSLSEVYEMTQVSFADGSTDISSNINTLIIAGAKQEFSEDELKSINSFVVRGGSLVALENIINVSNNLQSTENTSNLPGLLAKYGINLNKNLVGDVRSGLVPISNGFFTIPTQYPFWPKIEGEGFNSEYSAVSSLSSLILPWASSLSVDESKISKENYTYLLSTTNKSWKIGTPYDAGLKAKPVGTQSVQNLSVVVNAGLKNVYSENEEDNLAMGRIAVVGDADFISDNFLQGSPDNLTFFQNLIDSLSLDEDLIHIRSKIVNSRPIKENLTDGERNSMRYLNIFGVTITVLAFGMVRYYLRRKSKLIDQI